MEEYKIDIPDRFYSDAEGKPFENCQMCGKFLLAEGTTYVVEKAIKSNPNIIAFTFIPASKIRKCSFINIIHSFE